jgi:hypothetical protein
MENLFLLLPLAISVGNCLVSVCLFRKITSRLSFLEEKIGTMSSQQYPPPPPIQLYPPPPPIQSYPPSTQYYNVPSGYGYVHPGGQGNLNVV